MTLNKNEVAAAKSLIQLALVEDIGRRGDLTSYATIPERAKGQAEMVARKSGIIAGIPVAAMVFAAVDGRITFENRVDDASPVKTGDVIAIVSGSLRAILTGERTALNFVQHLSGVASLTRRYVDAIAGKSQILDTRKTTPGWRLLEK